jgi:hypothetical protein
MMMRNFSLIVVAIAAMLVAACAGRAPVRAGLAPGTPHIGWVIMHGDRDNPDQQFVCQSDPRNDCVMPVSRADAQVFSNLYVYYHRAGAETKYAGKMLIGFFRGGGEPAHDINITVPRNESITNQSISGIVTDTPGEYALTFELAATSNGNSQPISEKIAVAVR